MATLVVGASGATGRLLVEQLIAQGEKVKIIVRSVDRLPDTFNHSAQLEITEANLLEMTDAELLEQVQGCSTVASCLGHNLTFKGMFGHPRRLVTDAIQRLCHAIEKSAPDNPVKFILMNTSGMQNIQAGEKVSVVQSLVVGVIRCLIPPHADNEQAAKYLQTRFGAHQQSIEWVAVRPDSLIDVPSVTDYDTFTSPIRSAIFDAGNTSRINVAHFMSQLITHDGTWEKWKGKMPVVYNAGTSILNS